MQSHNPKTRRTFFSDHRTKFIFSISRPLPIKLICKNENIHKVTTLEGRGSRFIPGDCALNGKDIFVNYAQSTQLILEQSIEILPVTVYKPLEPNLTRTEYEGIEFDVTSIVNPRMISFNNVTMVMVIAVIAIIVSPLCAAFMLSRIPHLVSV